MTTTEVILGVLVMVLPSAMFFLGLLLGRRAEERDCRARTARAYTQLAFRLDDDAARRLKAAMAKAQRDMVSAVRRASDGPTDDNPGAT